MRIRYLLAVALVASFATVASVDASPTGRIVAAGSPNAIPGQYVVGLADGQSVRADARSLASKYGADVGYVYTAALHGFSARMSAGEAARMAANPAVDFVQQSVRVFSDTIAHGIQRNPPSWGLAQIDGAADGVYRFPNAGGGVHVYNTDTELNITHRSFEGRAESGWDFINDDPNVDDCNGKYAIGHGTHTAGTSSSQAYGVAKNDTVVGLKMMSCFGSGPDTAAIAAIDWITANAVKPAVANASWGSSDDAIGVQQAINNSIDSGITWVASAGNSNTDACSHVPGGMPRVITVAATRRNHARPRWSNWGPCVDLFAPGDGIVSAHNVSDTDTKTMSGTSMAAPHVTGAAALFLHSHPKASPLRVRNVLVNRAQVNYVVDPGPGSPNLFLDVADLG